jgi:hypothetical protein
LCCHPVGVNTYFFPQFIFATWIVFFFACHLSNSLQQDLALHMCFGTICAK